MSHETTADQEHRETIAANQEAGTDKSPFYGVIEGFFPGYLGRIAQMHGEYYEKAWGSGPGFEALMARELCDFCQRYTPDRDLLLTAHVGGTLVGCIAIDGTQSERPGMARLRWYLLDEEYQGRGIGNALLRRALDFCRVHSFQNVYLWTVEGLPKSLYMYEQAGFRIVERLVDSRYTVEHEQLRLEMPLRQPDDPVQTVQTQSVNRATKTETKCVLVLDAELPVGLAVNAAAVLSVSLGQSVPDMVGPDVTDASGYRHAGLVNVPIPILKATKEQIRAIRAQAEHINELSVVDLTEDAQSARTYEAYTKSLGGRSEEALTYRGIALYGGKQSVNKLTGSLPLLR